MIIHLTSATNKSPHRYPLGYTRLIRGERCMLYAYSTAGHPRYRRPDGTTFCLLPKVKRKKLKLPKVQRRDRVMVKLPSQQLAGVVVKRNPLRVRITDKTSEFYGCVIEKPRYRAVGK